MWDEEKFKEFVRAMEDTEPILKCLLCQRMANSPSGDARVLPYLEKALADETICRYMIPPTYAQVRWMAAMALAAERQVQGIHESVKLIQAVEPMLNDKASKIIDTHSQSFGIKSYKYAEQLNFLREAGLLKLIDVEFPLHISDR